MHAGFLRRLAAVEVMLHPPEAEPRGLSDVLAMGKRYGWDPKAPPDFSERPLRGLSLLLWEALHPGEPPPE